MSRRTLFKYEQRVVDLYYTYGLNIPFSVDEAAKTLQLPKENIRSSLEIALREHLICIDNYNQYNWYMVFRREHVKNVINRENLVWHDKLKTFYLFTESELIRMVKYLAVKPLDKDITPEVVKLFLNGEE